MRLSSAFGTVVLIPALCLCAQGQNTPSKDTQVNEAKGIPPRATPADYQAQAPAGTVTVAAEFVGHSVPTPEGTTFTTDDYVAIETALFGPPGARLKISFDEFSLRINAKKMPLPSQPFGMVFRSLKDPEWEQTIPVESKSKSSFGTGGKGGQGDSPPAPVHMPIALQRAMEQRVQKASLPEGDRALPQAGLIFFPYRGKVEGIHSIELTYTGPAGKATLTLQP
jgi:hypothetical protein